MAKSHPVSVANEPWVRPGRELKRKQKQEPKQNSCLIYLAPWVPWLYVNNSPWHMGIRGAISALLCQPLTWHYSSICFEFISRVHSTHTHLLYLWSLKSGCPLVVMTSCDFTHVTGRSASHVVTDFTIVLIQSCNNILFKILHMLCCLLSWIQTLDLLASR